MAVRLKDIAGDLGLSMVTVSKVLRNHPDIGEHTRKRVLKRVKELNYQPIMRAIKATGFKGFVGQEFLPKRDPLTSLREAVKLCAV